MRVCVRHRNVWRVTLPDYEARVAAAGVYTAVNVPPAVGEVPLVDELRERMAALAAEIGRL